jgi:putative tricarboxylic transport membrane protein
LKAGGALAAVMLVPGCGIVEVSTGEDYPSQQLRFIVPFPAGSAPDSTARALGEVLEEELGQPVVIENLPGGSGTIGLSELASTEADGYTLGYATASGLTMQWQLVESAFEGPDQVQVVCKVVENPATLFVNTMTGIEAVEDFVARAKEDPRSLKLGIPGEGSEQDLQVRLFAQQAGMEPERIYYEAGEQILPTVNDTIQAGISNPAVMLQYAERGDLKILGIFGEEKPEGVVAPLFSELGYDVEYYSWNAIVLPRGTPEERAQSLREAFEVAVSSDRFQEYSRENYIIPTYEGPEQVEQLIDSRVEANKQYIEEFDLKRS